VSELDDYVLTDAVEMDITARFEEPSESARPINNESQEAPWGVKADGTPRAKPGRKSSGSTTGTRTTTRASTSRSRRKNEPDYRPAISGLLQMVAFPLTMAGTAKPEFALDGAAIIIHTPAISEALHEVAINNPQVAAVLEQLMAVGPYGALIGALIPLAIQISANHKILPPSVTDNLGALPPDALIHRMSQMAGMATNAA
jgi:hypothetical protein